MTIVCSQTHQIRHIAVHLFSPSEGNEIALVQEDVAVKDNTPAGEIPFLIHVGPVQNIQLPVHQSI